MRRCSWLCGWLTVGCAGPGLSTASAPADQFVLRCEVLSPPPGSREKVRVQEVSVLGDTRFQVTVTGKGCLERQIDACWDGTLLTSGVPQVEFLLTKSPHQPTCLDTVTQVVRVFDFRVVRLAVNERGGCRVERSRRGDRVVCSVQSD